MHYLFEETHSLNTAAECFCCNAKRDSFPIRPHWHYFMEIILMLSGNAELNAGSESFRAAAGDMILFHPKAVHSAARICRDKTGYKPHEHDRRLYSEAPQHFPRG